MVGEGKRSKIENLPGLFVAGFVMCVICLLVIPGAVGHVDETANPDDPMQLYSYFTTSAPEINGDIADSDGSGGDHDDPAEWEDAYSRTLILASDNGSFESEATMLAMNDDFYLYLAFVWRSPSASAAGNDIEIFLDEGSETGSNQDGSHDDLLTNPAGEMNEDALLTDAATTLYDAHWNASSSAWESDGDMAIDYNASGESYSKAINWEFRIPLEGKSDTGSDSDLGVLSTDEIGIFIRFEVGGVWYYIKMTNSTGGRPTTATNWLDLKLGESSTKRTLYASWSRSTPDIDGDVTEDFNWAGAWTREFNIVDLNGTSIEVKLYLLEDFDSEDIFIGLIIADDDFDPEDRLTIYLDDNQNESLDGPDAYVDYGGSSDPDNGDDDALRILYDGTYLDMHANIDVPNSVIDWDNPETAGEIDGDGDANYYTDPRRYEFEILWDRAPSDDDNDCLVGDFGTAGFLIEYHDGGTGTNYYWNDIGNSNQTVCNAQGASGTYLSLGWGIIQTSSPKLVTKAPVDGGSVKGNDFTFSIDANAPTGSPGNVSFVGFRIESETTWTSLTYTGNGERWETEWDTTAFKNADYLVDIVVQSDSGAGGIVTRKTITITVDNPTSENPPSSVSFETSPISTGSGTVEVDATNADRVELYVDGQYYSDMPLNTGTGFYETELNTLEFTDGQHQLRARAVNTAGETSAYQDMTFDNWDDLNDVSIVDPIAGKGIEGKYTFLIDFEGDHVAIYPTPGYCELYIDGELEVIEPHEIDLTGAGDWGYSIPVNTVFYDEGSHSVRAVVYDPEGNSLFDSVSVTFNNKPTMQVISPSPNEVLSGVYALSLRATDPSGDPIVDSAQDPKFQLDGGTWFDMGNGLLSDDHLLISEVFFDPEDDEPDNEWIELFNPTPSDISISGWSLSTDSGNYTFGAFIVGSYDAIVVANNGTAFLDAYGSVPEIDTSGLLPELMNGGDSLTLNDGASDVDYVEWASASSPIWSVRPDADSGESIQRAGDYPDTDDPSDWHGNMASETPGVAAPVTYTATLDTLSLSEGEHEITLQVTDASGALTSTTIAILIDNIVLSSVEITELDTVRGYSNETDISGLIHDTAFVVAHPDPSSEAKYGELYINDGYAGYDNTLEGPSGSEFFEFEVDTVGYDDGSFRFRVVVYDSQGSTVSDTVVTSIENTPVVYINDPTEDEVISGSKVLNLTAYDRNGMYGSELRVDGGPWTSMTEIHAGIYPKPSYYEIEWNTLSVPDGPHRLTFLITDDGPNSVTTATSVNVIVDNNVDNPTLCSIVSPTPGEYVEGIFKLQVSGSDPNGIDSLKVNVDGQGWVDAVYDSATGFYVHSLDTKLLTDGGPHALEARATDAAGNSVNVTLDDGFYVDNDVPIPTSITPSEGAIVSGQVYIIVRTDDATISPSGSVEFRIDDGPWIDFDDLSSPHEASWHSTSFLDGHHTVTIKTTDAIGHEEVATIELTVDNTDPTVSVIQPSRGQYVSGIVSFVIKAEDSVDVETVTLTLNGTPLNALLNTASGYYELVQDTRLLPDGEIAFEVLVEDIAGWTASTGEILIRVDNTKPSLSAFVFDGTYVSGTVDVAGNFTFDDEFLLAAEYRIDDGGWTDVSVPWVTNDYSEGQHLVSLRASDTIGNEVSSTVKVIVDNHLPEIGYVSYADGAILNGVEQLAVSAFDENRIHEVSFQVDDGQIQYLLSSPTTGLYEYDLDTLALTDGVHSIDIVALDESGSSSSVSLEVTIDNTGPETIIRSIDVNSDGQVTVTVEANDPNGVKSAQVNIDGQGWKDMVYDERSSKYRYIFKTSESDNGRHWVEVRSLDGLGNEASATQSFEVNNPSDYIGMIVDLVPLIAFLFLVAIIILVLFLWKIGKLGILMPNPEKRDKVKTPNKAEEEAPDVKGKSTIGRKPATKTTTKPDKSGIATSFEKKGSRDQAAKFEELLAKVEKGHTEAIKESEKGEL